MQLLLCPYSAARAHETFKNLKVWYSLLLFWMWLKLTNGQRGSKGISEVRQTDGQTFTCAAYVRMHTLPSLPELLHKSDFLRKPGWKKEWREVKQDTIQLLWGYCKEHLSNCLEYCVQSCLQCSRKAIIVLKRMRSCKIMKIMCCVS